MALALSSALPVQSDRDVNLAALTVSRLAALGNTCVVPSITSALEDDHLVLVTRDAQNTDETSVVLVEPRRALYYKINKAFGQLLLEKA